MYYFNFSLFSKLNLLFDTSRRDMSLKLYGNAWQYGQKIEKQDRITVLDVVNTCNILKISISHFITLEADTYYRDRITEYIIDDILFKPIVFNNRSLTRMYGKDGLAGNISRENLSKRINVSPHSFYLWINQEICMMKIHNLLDMCNTFGVNIDNFITDENIPLPMNNVTVDTKHSSSGKQLEELVELREVVTHQQREIADLKRKNQSLELSVKGYQVAEEHQSYSSLKKPIRNWVFNKDLLNCLPELLHKSKDDFFKGVGLSNPAISYHEGNIFVQSLITICNKYHLSSKHFFIRETPDWDSVRELSFYQSDNFEPVKFHPDKISDISGFYSLTDMNMNEVLTILDRSEMRLRGWRNVEKSTLRVNDLVDICNLLEVTPSCFITDTNKTTSAYGITTAEFFLEGNRMLRQEIIRLNKRINRLKKKEE